MTATPEVTATDVSSLTADHVSARPCGQCAPRTLLGSAIGQRSRDVAPNWLEATKTWT
jgi:hypothetical protein